MIKMTEKVPPDGGWGWMVVIGSSLNGLSIIPIMQGFGLIFKDAFVKMGISAIDNSILINVNMAFGTLLGLVNGPLLRKYGYRKVALAGGIFFPTGIILTAFADSFAWFIFSYGIITSIGGGLLISSFSYALNSYFVEKRSRATGLNMTIIGLGPIIMPQATSWLLSYYGLQGTVLLFGAVSFHSLVGALLLQPIKWHLKEIRKDTENIITDRTEYPEKSKHDKKTDPQTGIPVNNSNTELRCNRRSRKITISSINHDTDIESTYNFGTSLSRQLSSPSRSIPFERNISISNYGASILNLSEEPIPRSEETWYWDIGKSSNSVNLSSCANIFDENAGYIPLKNKSEHFTCEQENDNSTNDKNDKTESTIMRILRRIAAFYDLGLLRDPIYVNIMLGASMALFAEINFSMLTPFILSDMKLSTAKIANVMSTTATIDLIMRCVAPFIGEWLHQSARAMYLYSLVLLIIARSCLIFVCEYSSVLFVATGLGIGKGIRSVYMSQVIPSHVPIHRLPYASGIRMIVHGTILMSAGPILGVIRDATGSYTRCIIMINFITGLTVTAWTVEKIILSVKRKRNAQQNKNFIT